MNKERYSGKSGKAERPEWYNEPVDYEDMYAFLKENGLSKVRPLIPGGGCMFRMTGPASKDKYIYGIFTGTVIKPGEYAVQGPDGHLWSVLYYNITGVPYEKPPKLPRSSSGAPALSRPVEPNLVKYSV